MKRKTGVLAICALACTLAGGGAAVGANVLTPEAIVVPAKHAPAAAVPEIKRAEFRGQEASAEVHHVADWAVHSADNKGHPFIVVDKVNAKLFAFDRYGVLIDQAPVLLGMGVGDKFAPGVLKMDMYKTKPWQRITPAGRYFAEQDRNIQGEIVLWVDYDAGIAIHKLPSKVTKQRRHERIVSPDPAEHRITYGCINVPPAFYDRVVRPYFGPKGGYVYVLPDTTPLNAVFKTDDVKPRQLARNQQAGERPATLQRF
jgi:hypothetical protein